MLFQPSAGAAVIRIHGFYSLPEGGGVIHMRQMTEFMNDDIIQNSRGCKHKTPVEGESALGAAASPAGLLVPYGDAIVSAAGELAEIGCSLREVFLGGDNISLCQGIALCICQTRDWLVYLFLLLFQIFCDDPVLLLTKDLADFPVTGHKRDAYGDLSVGGDADGIALALAADQCVRKFIGLALVFDA